ncbi:Metalloreductase steap4 [Bulinus truncatus]|nr:Metalloreductase steap4 [Bulinus truncatus]
MGPEVHSEKVSIIGTGNFGRALGKRLINTGYFVTFGSRKPEVRKVSSLKAFISSLATVASIEDAIRASDVVFLCIAATNFEEFTLRYRRVLLGKILIDVSKGVKHFHPRTSNAETLQGLLPEAKVVKAFNGVSAYAMDVGFVINSREVPVASDSNLARAVVMEICRGIGFRPHDAGMLVTSRRIEKNANLFFPQWIAPVVTAVCVYLLWWIYVVYIYFIKEVVFTWEQIFVKVSNEPLCMTAITMLALTYLPGCLAAIHQLVYDTKYRKFPSWLHSWLKTRKHLGLISFILACMHASISTLILSPTYFRSWFITIENTTNQSTVEIWMNWKGELSCLIGVLALFTLSILAVTSLPSVADSLNWKEWKFLQTKLGFLSMLLAVGHVWVMGVPSWMNYESWTELLTSTTFASSVLPLTVVMLRVVQWLPFIGHRLRQIRQGDCDDAPHLTLVTTQSSSGPISQGASVMSSDKNADQAIVPAGKHEPSASGQSAVKSCAKEASEGISGKDNRSSRKEDAREIKDRKRISREAMAATARARSMREENERLLRRIIEEPESRTRQHTRSTARTEVTSKLINDVGDSDSSEELVSRV